MKVTVEFEINDSHFDYDEENFIEQLDAWVDDAEGVKSVEFVSATDREENPRNLDALTKETFNPDNFTFVDLGLPSKRLWATENAPDYYTYDDAKEVFGKYLPKANALVELWEECEWTWNKEKKGYDVVGPNGNSIFMPASGCRGRASGSLYDVGGRGSYWSYASNSQTNAYRLYFGSSYLYPMDGYSRAHEFSVRPCRECF